MKKPRKSGPRRRRKSPHDIPALQKHEVYFMQAHNYEPSIAPRHFLTKMEQSALARSEAALTRSDLTAEEAGDVLLALVETKQLKVRVSDFAGAVVDELGLPALGLALLLEAAMRRRHLLVRQARDAASAHHQQVGTVERSLRARSEPPATASAEQGAH